MRRILLLLTVALVMVATTAATAMPAFARENCTGGVFPTIECKGGLGSGGPGGGGGRGGNVSLDLTTFYFVESGGGGGGGQGGGGGGGGGHCAGTFGSPCVGGGSF
jgi:hypothetical protein